MNTIKLTTLDAAHRQLALAVRLFFNDGDPVCVHTLVCAAREIYEKTLKEACKQRMFDLIEQTNPDRSDTQLWNILNNNRNFFKHPKSGTLEFSDEDNDCMLLIASFDCMELCGNSCPSEADAFLIWMKATSTLFRVNGRLPMETEADQILHDLDARYPGLRDAHRTEKKRFGRSLFPDGCLVIIPPMS